MQLIGVSSSVSMSKSCFHLLLLMLVLSLPLLGEFKPEAMLEHFADRFQRHALDVWVEEYDEQPANEADATIEAKRSGRGYSFHHG